MKKTTVFVVLAALLLLFSFDPVYAQIVSRGTPNVRVLTNARRFVPPPDRKAEKSDSLKKIYLELKVGMSLQEVHDLAEKHYPKLKLEDTDIWGETSNASQDCSALSWVLGTGGNVTIGAGHAKTGKETPARLYRIVLRIDFDKELKLKNAVYIRNNEKDFKRIEPGDSQFSAKADERKALVGDGYCK